MRPDPIHPDSLLRHAAFVKAVARELVRSPQDREDLEQDTWLVAIERPPREPDSALRWLRRVMSRLALRVRTAEDRRRRREFLVRGTGETVPTVETVSSLELHREVVAATLALPEAYRSVVVERYFEGRSVRQIAADRGEPGKTIETRLRRALIQVRRSLERSIGPEALPALIAIGQPAVQGTAIASIGSTMGGVLVTTKGKFLAAAVLVIVGLWTWSALRSPDSAAAEQHLASTTDVASPEPEEAAASGGESRRREPLPVSGAAADTADVDVERAASWMLTGRIEGVVPSLPFTGVVRVVAWFDTLAKTTSYEQRPSCTPVEASCKTNEQGELVYRAELDAWFQSRERPARIEIRAEDPAYVSEARTVVPPSDAARDPEGLLPWTVDLKVRSAAVVGGLVVDELGVPLPRTQVGLLVGGREPVDLGRTDAGGRYRLRSDRAGRASVVALRAPLFRRGREVVDLSSFLPAEATVEMGIGLEVEAPVLTLRRGRTLEGEVRSSSGEPVAGAVVLASPEPASEGSVTLMEDSSLVRGPRGVSNRQCLAVSDAEGRFHFTDLPEGDHRLEVTAVGTARVLGGDTVLHRSTDTARPTLSAGVPVELAVYGGDERIREADGLARLGSSTRMENLSAGGLLFEADRPTVWLPPETDVVLWIGAEGFTTQECSLHLLASTREHWEEIDLVPAETSSRSILLRLHSDSGPLPLRAGVWFRDAKGGKWERSLLVDEDGRCELGGMEPGPTEVRVRAGGEYSAGEGLFREATFEVQVPDTGSVEVDVALEAAGRLRVSARDEKGALVAAEVTLIDEFGEDVEFEMFDRQEQNGTWFSTSRLRALSREGTTLFDPPLEPGRYELALRLPGYRDAFVPVEIEVGRTTEVEVVLERR